MIGLIYAAQGQRPPEGPALQVDLKVFEYSLAEIPTHHIEECFSRAFRHKRDDYPLRAAAVNQEWDVLKQELLDKAVGYAAAMDRQLESGHGSVGRMTLDEWKTRHNLPATWQLGQPFPPESDLYRKPVPEAHQMQGRCGRCGGVGWLRKPADMRNEQLPQLVRCPDCY